MDTSKVVSYSSLAAIIKDDYEFVREFVIMFLESKLIKLTIDSGRRHAKSSCNIS